MGSTLTCNRCGGWLAGDRKLTGHYDCGCFKESDTVPRDVVTFKELGIPNPLNAYKNSPDDEVMEIEVNGQKYYYSKEIEQMVKDWNNGIRPKK